MRKKVEYYTINLVVHDFYIYIYIYKYICTYVLYL